MDERISLHESFNLCDTRVDYISDDTIVQRAGNTIVFVSITTRKQSILTFDAGLSLDCYAVSGSSVTGPGIGQVVVALHGLDGSQLQIYSWPKKQKIATIKGDCLIYAGLSLTRDGKHLAALSKIGTGTLYYYSLQTLTRILSVPVTEDSTIISFNPFNSNQILTGHSKRLTIWTISQHTTFQQPTMIQYPIALDAINKLDRQLLCHSWVADSRLYMATRGGQILECCIPSSSSSSSHTTTVTSPTNATSTQPTTPLPLLLAGIGIPLTTPATETTRTEGATATTTSTTPDVSPLPVQVVVTRIPIISQGESRDDYHLSDERIAYHQQQQAHVTLPSKSSRRGGHDKSPLHSPGTGISTGTSNTFANHLASPTAQPPVIDPIPSPSSSTSLLTKGALIYSISVTRQHIVVGTDDGTLLWISRYNDQLMYFQHLEQSVGSGICCLTFSPSFASFITLTVRGHLRLLRLVGDMMHSRHANDEPIFQTVTLGHFPVAVTLRSRKPVKYGMAVVPMPPTDLSVKNARVVSYGSNGSLQLWCYGQRTLLANLMFRSSITCVTCSPDGCVAVVGLASGVIAVLDLTKANASNTGGAGAVRLIFAQRFHAGPVVAIEFNKDGDVFATLGPKKLFFIRTGDLRVLGYVSHIHLHTSTSSDDDEDLELYVENANIDVDVMTLIWGGPADVSTGSHGHERLAIITKTGIVTVINAPNTFHEAQELRLDPAFLAPVITTLSTPLVSCITALDDHNIIYAFNTEHQLCVYELNNDAVLIQKHIHKGHELQGTSIALSLNGQFMATTGMDGIIHIRPMHSLDQIEAIIPAHDFSQGGTHTVAFSPDSTYILSSGVDGGLFCWDISEIRGESQPRKLRMLPVAVSTKMLDASHEVEEPAASSPSFLERYVSTRTIAEKDLRQRQLRQELLTSLETFRTNYQAALARNETVPEMEKLPLTQFAIDLEARDRWLAESDAEVERVRSETIHTMLGKQLIATRIKQQCWDSMEIVGHQIAAFKSELEVSNFPLRILSNQEQAMIRKIAHLRKMEIIERRWRYNQSLRTDDEVDRNFHPNKFTEEVPYIMNVDDGLYVPSDNSRMNAGNLTSRKPVGKGATTVTTTTTSTSSTGLSKDARDQPKDEVSLSQDLPKFLLYHPLDCITATRKRSQASLLAVKIDSMKRTFNEQFMEFYMQKQREIDHIHEKAKRITEIQAELQLDHPIYRPSLSADEIPTSVLSVDDSEITAPKVLSREERELAAQRAALMASQSAQQDDGPTRALDVMMGGTLESKRDLNLLEQELVREEWMNLPPEQMNEEQKLELARFEKKVKIIQAEQETRRKLLHTELSKLKSDVSDICRTFDNRLKNLIDTRVGTQRELYQHELMIIKLMNALVVEEEYEIDEHHLTSSLAELNNIKVATSQAVTEFKKELDTYAKYVENVQLEEKAMDRQFRKEFTDAGEHLEYLYKLFKLRKLIRGTTKKPTRRTERGDRTSISLSNINMMLKEEKERGTTPPHETSRPSSSGRPTILPPLQHRPGSSGEEGYEVKKKAARHSRLSRRSISVKDSRTDSRMGDDEGDGLNPFGEPFSSTDGDTDAPKYMDLDPSEMPESLHLDIWVRFLDKRRAQIDKEWECKKTSARLQEMIKHYQHLQHVDTAVSTQIKSLATQKVTLQQQRHIFQLNTEVMLKIMQGQVEIEESPVVTDLKACEMLERHIVESLNTVITKLGREKVDILRETTGSRTAINLLEWTRKKLDLEHKDAVDLTTELQLLRVTKSLQSLIKMGGHDNQKAAELKSLDRKMEFVKQAASEVSMGKKMKLLKVKKRIRMQHRENERLLETVAELESAVKERMQISAIRADGRVEDERAGRDRMKALVTRRKLVDLAKLQSEEIKFLRDQVESLRRRTFASFAVPQLSANPDEYSHHPSPPEQKNTSVIQRVPVKTDKHTVGAIIADARAQTR